MQRRARSRNVFFSSLIVAGLSACASEKLGAVPLTKGSPARSLASVTARVGMTCFSGARIFSGGENFQSWNDWAEARGRDGSLRSDLANRLGALTPDEQMKALSLALAEADAYGAMLVKDFYGLVDRGYTLDRIQAHSPVYARLQSLYSVRRDLGDLAAVLFRDRFIRALDGVSSDEDAPAEHASLIAREEVKKFRAELAAPITNQVNDSRFATLATAEISELLAQIEWFSSSPGCGEGGATEMKIGSPASNSREVIQAAKSLKNQGKSLSLFQSASSGAMIPVVRLVEARAEFFREKITPGQTLPIVPASPSPSPQPSRVSDLGSPGVIEGDTLLTRPLEIRKSQWGSVFFPDAGKKGNVSGSNFPKGDWSLTYDDGPVSPHTEKNLENLKKNSYTATYFILSGNIGKNGRPDLALREQAAGHAVESHSFTHPQFAKISDTDRHYQVEGAAARFKSVLGVLPRFFRLPYGQGLTVPAIRSIIANAGMVHVFWNVDTLDWQIKDPDAVYAGTLKQMRANGRGVILFHDVHPQSVIASERVMRFIKDPANHLRAVTIPEIVDQMNGRK
ncbi:MAG: polysaccharide deacetylase family protein [Cryobacterium sp.]|nr:polysaccharide deacetylase family protein [Oligoflexia bacterium]